MVPLSPLFDWIGRVLFAFPLYLYVAGPLRCNVAGYFMPCADAAAAIENRREATQESYEVNDKNKKNELIGMMLWLQGK